MKRCYTGQGAFNIELCFVNLTGEVPSLCSFNNDNTLIDTKKLTHDLVSSIFPNVLFVRVVDAFSQLSTSAVKTEDDEGEEFDFRIGGSWIDKEVVVVCTTEIFRITQKQITIYYSNTRSLQEIQKEYTEIYEKLPKVEEAPKPAHVKLVAYDNGYYCISSAVNKVDLNIDELYNDDFKPVYEELLKFINTRSSGLVILRGTKGTGKTSMIRHLTSNYPNEYIIVTNAVASHLANPEFISFMIEHKDSIFILEDCEQILMERSENSFGNAIANILNMTDGLMSDIFNVKFICTFNADITKIDSALLRKGRCFVNYEFKELCAEKVEKLAEKNNIKLSEIKPMTLADVFNYDDIDCETKKPVKKIGFR